jgi:8-oxo-dGTP pyrophosphatase MutT (NUDIX family)
MTECWQFSDLPEEAAIKPITSAGVLPYAVFKKRVYFLLGKENFNPGFGDSDKWALFGGKVDEGESVEDAGAREFYEETAGCVMGLPEAKERIRNKEYLLQSDLHPAGSSSFRMYMMLVPYRDYPSMFRHTKHFLQHVGADVSVIEKAHLKWFTYSEVHDAVFYQWGTDRYARKPKLRPKFAEMMRRVMVGGELERRCIQSCVY